MKKKGKTEKQGPSAGVRPSLRLPASPERLPFRPFRAEHLLGFGLFFVMRGTKPRALHWLCEGSPPLHSQLGV